MKKKKVIIIGGGAAGLMAATRAAQCGCKVILLEKMARTGRKIGISGKGRCNLTNTVDRNHFADHFGRNGRFLRQCFQLFCNDELVIFFESGGLKLTCERGGRIFPESGRALDVVHYFNNRLKEQKVEVLAPNKAREIVISDQTVTGVRTESGFIPCDAVILATGGKSYPRTGSTGDGYQLAKYLGHSLIPPRPALVPLESNDPSIRKLSGLELRNIQVRVFSDGKKILQEFGELSFTATGLSGPIILTLSKQIVEAMQENKAVHLSLDLKPALAQKKLDNRLIRDFQTRGGEPLESILRGLLPASLIPICISQNRIDSQINTREFPAKLRKQLGHWLKNFQISISGYRSWDEAIITSGGIHLKEIDPRTMESRLIKNLYIVGELLDLQADTGGFNLQAAFSTGWLAGTSVAKRSTDAL